MYVRQFRLIKLLVCRTLCVCVCVCVCVGEIIFLPWFSKELKTTYQRTTGFVSSLYLSFANQYLLGGGFPFFMWTSLETPARTHYMFQMVQ